jgi:hypothetical protein
MKKLSKDQIGEIANITDSLRTTKMELDSAIEVYNKQVLDACSELGIAVQAINHVIDTAIEFRDSIIQEIDDYAGERSEKWQGSDACGKLQQWKSEFEELELEYIDIEIPETLEPCDFDEEKLTNVRESVYT